MQEFKSQMSFNDLLDILYEDNHCIAVNKPCGWPSAHFDGNEETVDRLVKSYLKEKYQKPGNVFLGIVHRLDKPVSGVLMFARTSKGAARLSEQFRENGIESTTPESHKTPEHRRHIQINLYQFVSDGGVKNKCAPPFGAAVLATFLCANESRRGRGGERRWRISTRRRAT